MTHHGITLHDMMVRMLPEAEDHLDPRHLANMDVITLKELRLVNREFRTTALRYVKSCEVHVGEGGGSPSPEQLVGLMADADLVKLKFTVTVTSGQTAPSAAQQLSSCLEQVAFLVNDMSDALGSVYSLKLEVIYKRSRPLPGHFSASDVMSLPDGLEVVAAGVFAALAPLVPYLHELEVTGCCQDIALPAFGASCPYLKKLNVQALRVPITALHTLAQHVPTLETMIISNYIYGASHALSVYADALLLQLQHCNRLTRLCFNLHEDTTLACKAESWGLLPESLNHLAFGCFVETSNPFEILVRRVTALVLQDSPYTNLLELVMQFGVLESLKVMSDHHQMWLRFPQVKPLGYVSDDDEVDPQDLCWLSLLQERVQDESFLFTCLNFGLGGTSEQLWDMLGWLSPFPATVKLTVEVAGVMATYCLQPVPELFPILDVVTVEGDATMPNLSNEDSMEFLSPLTDCFHLTELFLRCPQLSLSAHELTQLCMGMPSLCILVVEDCHGVSIDGVQMELHGLGRVVKVTAE